MSTPLRKMLPEVGRKSPEIVLKRVVFPDPFVPIIARRSPGCNSRDRSSKAARAPNFLPTPRRDSVEEESSERAGFARDIESCHEMEHQVS